MSAEVMTLLAHHGPVILMSITLLASLALPLPASFALLGAGALTAAGDLPLPRVLVAALAGAAVGDVLAYLIGRWGGTALWSQAARRPKMERMLDEARAFIHRYASPAVLLSRWPFSPLGPYVSAVSGASGLPMPRFVALSVTGNAIWILLYVGLGHVFAARIKDVGQILSLVALGAALALAGGLLIRWSRRRVA